MLSSAALKSKRETFTDPAVFQRRVLKRKIWSAQQRIAHAVETRRHIAVKGCHASGKTFLAAGLVPWWLTRYEKGKVVTVSPTLRQVKVFWDEVEIARRGAGIRFPECSTTGMRVSEESYGLGISSSRGVNIQGFHGSDILIIADEAPGIEADLWESIEGIRAGGKVTLLELGNPTINSGHFFENFQRGRSTCECITISAFDSPNLEGVTIEQLLAMDEDQIQIAPWPQLTTREWVRDRYRRWGPSNAAYISRVLGEFPSQADDSVYSLEWIEAAAKPAKKRDGTEYTQAELLAILQQRGEQIHIGIDVAGPGEDETVMCARVGGVILELTAFPGPDPRAELLKHVSAYRTDKRFQLGSVQVDIDGIGYYFAQFLADNKLPVHGFRAGAAPLNAEHFANHKAEAYWCLREWLERRAITGLTDEEAQAQLAGIRYSHTPAGRVEIESKADARKRGVSSPDRAEAIVMAFVPVVPRHQRTEYQADDDLSLGPI